MFRLIEIVQSPNSISEVTKGSISYDRSTFLNTTPPFTDIRAFTESYKIKWNNDVIDKTMARYLRNGCEELTITRAKVTSVLVYYIKTRKKQTR